MFEKMKIKIKKFMDTIAKQNQSTYGDKKINCCDLNKPKNDKK